MTPHHPSPAGRSSEERSPAGFRPVPRTGVIYVSHRAAELGFRYGHPEWANLGQGSPETGALPEGAARLDTLTFHPSQYEYAPLAGDRELRQAVAEFYNAVYRAGRKSLYTADNVAISGGGRSGLTRIAAALGSVNMGHVIPDYTAYEELLTIFRAFTPIPLPLPVDRGYHLTAAELDERIASLGLGALLISNPCNPTGAHVRGEELEKWCAVARARECAIVFDEFYSHYLYGEGVPESGMVSAAACVEDVEKDPVIVVDGLTKNWRYPGMRVSWTLGPSAVIDALASAGSFLDGGASHPMQRAAIPLLDPALSLRETAAIRAAFTAKRAYVLERLAAMGLRVDVAPEGAFYCWVSLRDLPETLRDGMAFFESALREKVIVVPGEFFDVNPGKRRAAASRYKEFVRVSFGPDRATLRRGMDGLERAIAAA